MKKTLTALSLAALFSLPTLANARPVTITAQMNNYGGNRAYLAIYLVDPNGAYDQTLHVAGGNSNYYRHLGGWLRASRGRPNLAGVTGASVGSGRSMQVTVDIADSLIDAGYEVHVDAVAEGYRESPNEVVVPLAAASSGMPKLGRGYISTFQIDM